MSQLSERLVVALLGSAICAGCQAPESNAVPWWRGIPARLTSASSLEAEAWRRQHGYAGQAQPLPSRVMVGPLVAPGETHATPPMADEPEDDAKAMNINDAKDIDDGSQGSLPNQPSDP